MYKKVLYLSSFLLALSAGAIDLHHGSVKDKKEIKQVQVKIFEKIYSNFVTIDVKFIEKIMNNSKQLSYGKSQCIEVALYLGKEADSIVFKNYPFSWYRGSNFPILAACFGELHAVVPAPQEFAGFLNNGILKDTEILASVVSKWEMSEEVFFNIVSGSLEQGFPVIAYVADSKEDDLVLLTIIGISDEYVLVVEKKDNKISSIKKYKIESFVKKMSNSKPDIKFIKKSRTLCGLYFGYYVQHYGGRAATTDISERWKRYSLITFGKKE